MFKTFQHLRWIIVGLTAVVLFHITIENTAAKKWEIVSQLPTGRSAFSTAVAAKEKTENLPWMLKYLKPVASQQSTNCRYVGVNLKHKMYHNLNVTFSKGL